MAYQARKDRGLVFKFKVIYELRLSRALSECIDRWAAGERLELRNLATPHREMAPALRQELETIARVHSLIDASGISDETLGPRAGMR
jgi:hypothetical protein